MSSVQYIELPKGTLFSPEQAAARRMWAEYWISTFKGVARAAGYGVFVGGSLVRDVDVVCIPWRNPLGHTAPVEFVLSLVHSMHIVMGNHGRTLYGHEWYALWDHDHPDQQIDLKIITVQVEIIQVPDRS